MLGKEIGECLAEGITALWRNYSTSWILPLYGRIFDLHRNGIYAILSEGKIISIRIDIQLIDIRYTNLWTDQQAYSMRGRRLCRALHLHLIAIDIDRPFHMSIDQIIGIDRHFHVPIGHSNGYRSTV